MKDAQLWKLFVRKPLRWFLRRFLPTEETDKAIEAIEALVIAAQANQ